MTDSTVFTPSQIAEDGANRVARTSAQVLASQVVTVVDWSAHEFLHWSGEMPTPVAVAVGGLLTVGASYWMNRRRIQGKQPSQ